MRLVAIESIVQRVSVLRTAAATTRSPRWRLVPFAASAAILGFVHAGGPAADAANFTCSWNDATANWTTVADWSTCNGTFPNNSGGNTYDATIAQGNPTLTFIPALPTGITIGSVTINSAGVWTFSGTGAATGAKASLTGDLTN